MKSKIKAKTYEYLEELLTKKNLIAVVVSMIALRFAYSY